MTSRELLGKLFKGRINFYSPVDIQNTMALGSHDDIRKYCYDMFINLYYWDTYFSNLGLIKLGNNEQSKNNIETGKTDVKDEYGMPRMIGWTAGVLLDFLIK